ncbi:uncharacterized protein RCC_04680 [Ramularia collo-cygni]|uniref:Uncharacterized protein n=1 Tax=Ramularia collo-cygni TaxID=112498 RepID=A0A2D3UWZ9_9PEZI|nr:uncharacterized protein RCC_04680 [Ramularia collo-cygni]CZT18835.1 uncharacterized protein RCC_04680 [Ramularia collo-cygni]
MNPEMAEDRATRTVIAELSAAYKEGDITGYAFWCALDCARSHLDNPQDLQLKHATDVIAGLVRTLVAFPESGRALEVYARGVLKVLHEKGNTRRINNARPAATSSSTAN